MFIYVCGAAGASETEREGLEQQLLIQRQNELVTEILTGLRDTYEVEINVELVETYNNIS